MVGCGRAIGRDLLVGQVGNTRTGGQEGEINLLSVVGVERETVGSTRNAGDLGDGADGTVKDVIVSSGNLSRRDRALGLTTGDGQSDGGVKERDTNVDQVEAAGKGRVAGTDSVEGGNKVLDHTDTGGSQSEGVVPRVGHSSGEKTNIGDAVVAAALDERSRRG